MKYIDESEAYERYDEMLDECHEPMRIGDLVFYPSEVLSECDPIAYRCGFNDWLDSEDLTTDEDEAEAEDEAIED